MDNGSFFLDKVLDIVKEEYREDVPLIQFKHPKELLVTLDLDISEAVSDEELEKCVKQVLKYSVKTHKSTFKNQLFGTMDPYGLCGAWLTEAFNTSQYTYEVAPAFSLIEQTVLNHVLKLFGIPDGDGIFSPGGSMSLLYGIVTARFKAFPEVKAKGIRGLPELVLFTSQDSHYSMMKAAHWLGFGTESVKIIPTTPGGQMLVEQLEAAIVTEKAAGRYPLLVNATAGTTVLGAIDDIDAIADVCQKYGIWMHVDACWGGSLILSDKYKHRLKGIHRAQSLSWNPHKMAGAPLQCSLLLVSERGVLHRANAAAADYLFQQDKFYDVTYDTGDKSVQCGRKIDSFKLWVMWKARGDAGLRSLADGALLAAETCLRLVSDAPGFRLVSTEMYCPNVCFWYIPTFMRNKDEDDEWWNKMHKITPKIKEILMVSSRLMVAYSPLRQYKNFFRLAFTFHPRLEERHVRDILQRIQHAGETVHPDL